MHHSFFFFSKINVKISYNHFNQYYYGTSRKLLSLDGEINAVTTANSDSNAETRCVIIASALCLDKCGTVYYCLNKTEFVQYGGGNAPFQWHCLTGDSFQAIE